MLAFRTKHSVVTDLTVLWVTACITNARW